MLRKIQINETKLRNTIRKMLQEGSWGYEPLQSDQALDFRDNIYNEVIQQIIKGLRSGQTGLSYGALGALVEFMSMLLEKTNFPLFCSNKDKELNPAVAEALKLVKTDKAWLENWSKPDEVLKEIDKTEKKYEKLKKEFIKKYNLNPAGLIDESRLLEHDNAYEPLNSDSAFDFRFSVIEMVLSQIKKRLLSKRGQDVYDAIGVLNDFLEKFAFDHYMDFDDKYKSLDDAVKKAFKTARADKEWINAWKDPKMLVTMIDAEEKKYNNFYNINNLQRKLYGKRLKIDETRLRREIKAKLINESYTKLTAAEVDDVDFIQYEIYDQPDEEDIEEAIQDKFNGQEYSNEQRQAFINEYMLDNTVYILYCGNYDEQPYYFEGTYDEISYMFNEKIADEIKENEKGIIEDVLSDYNDIDLNNTDNINQLAKAKFANNPLQQSFYLMTDGTMLGMPDHCYVSAVGNQTKASFMNIGNIRVSRGAIGLMKKPTPAQIAVIQNEILPQYPDQRFEVHFCQYRDGDREPHSVHITQYYNPASAIGKKRVINDILNYYNDGIKPSNRSFD